MSDLEYYNLDDTASALHTAAEHIKAELREEHDIPEEKTIYIYELDADVSEETFEVGVLLR